MDRKRGLLHNLGWLTAGQIASQLLNVWVLILLAQHLGPYHFGIVQLGVAFLAYALITAEWGLMSLGVRDVARLEDPGAIHRYCREHTGLMGVLALAVLGLGLALLPHLSFVAADPWVFRIYLAVVLPQVFTHTWIAAGRESLSWVGISRVTVSGVYALLVFGLLASGADRTGWPTYRLVPAAYLVAFTAGNLPLIIPLRRWFGRLVLPALPSSAEAIRRLRQTAPIGAGIVVLRVLLNIDLVLLGLLATPAVAGQYAAASRLIFLLVGGVEMLWGALLPRLSRLATAAPTEYRRQFNLYLGLVLAVLLPVAVGGLLTGPALTAYLFRGEYPLAGPVLQVLAVSYALLGVAFYLGKALIAEDRQDRHFGPVVISAATALAANWGLIPRYGALGAAWGMLAAHGLLLLLLLRLFRGRFDRTLADIALGLLPGLAALTAVVLASRSLGAPWRILGGAAAYLAVVAWPLRRILLRHRGEEPVSEP